MKLGMGQTFSASPRQLQPDSCIERTIAGAGEATRDGAPLAPAKVRTGDPSNWRPQ